MAENPPNLSILRFLSLSRRDWVLNLITVRYQRLASSSEVYLNRTLIEYCIGAINKSAWKFRVRILRFLFTPMPCIHRKQPDSEKSHDALVSSSSRCAEVFSSISVRCIPILRCFPQNGQPFVFPLFYRQTDLQGIGYRGFVLPDHSGKDKHRRTLKDKFPVFGIALAIAAILMLHENF